MATDIAVNDYPTTDHKPMAETDVHRILMVALIQMLEAWFARQAQAYVSGNLLIFYEPGNKRKHVSPDVFVVKGVPKGNRINFLTWEEGHGPCVVIELTSSSTRHEDMVKKFKLYQDVLKVHEYFLFDPRDDYLEPRLQGFRLVRGQYTPIRPVKERLPSKELALHLETDGDQLRLWDPAVQAWLRTPQEEVERLKNEVQRLRGRLNGK
jgi:Uma2 family endonuclease